MITMFYRVEGGEGGGEGEGPVVDIITVENGRDGYSRYLAESDQKSLQYWQGRVRLRSNCQMSHRGPLWGTFRQ